MSTNDPRVMGVGRIEFGPHREDSTVPDAHRFHPEPVDIFQTREAPGAELQRKLDRIIELLERLVSRENVCKSEIE